MLLDTDTSFHIDIANDVLSGFQLVVELLLERSIEAVLIDFFIFEKVIGRDALSKGFGRQEVVFHSVPLRPTRRPAGGTDGKVEVHATLEEIVHQCAFT